MNNNFDDKDFQTSESYYDQQATTETASAEGQTDPVSAEPSVEIGAAPAAPQENPELHKAEMITMILGIIALVLSSCCCINIVLAIISLVYASKVKKLSPNGKMSGSALAGVICSIISLCLMALVAIFYIIYFVIFFILMGASGELDSNSLMMITSMFR